MRCLFRNTRKIYYSKVVSKRELKDEYGNNSGEYEVIYTNPFARYDASRYDMPQRNEQHSVNILYTLLFNLALLVLVVGVVLAYIKL